MPLTRFRAEQCRHNIRQGETVRNVLLVVFYGRNSPRAEIDIDALNKLETAAIALDGDINKSAAGR